MLRKKFIHLIAIVLIVMVTFSIGVWYGQKQIPFVGSQKIINAELGMPGDIDFGLFWDTWRLLEEKSPTTPDKKKMFYGAIGGLVNSLDDPYTIFMDPSESQKFAEDLSGVFDGIGAEIGIKKGVVTVISPLTDSPAERAGLKSMDKILKINDTGTIDLALDEAVNLIRGPKGTEVTLTILRGSESDTREIKIIRATIEVKSVDLKFIDSGESQAKENIAVLKISKFGDDTYQGVLDASNEILSKGAKKIILDLRNNPGGYLNSAVDVAGIFIPAGKTVTSEKFSGHKKDYLANGADKLGGIPMVILANEGSASAAEILAGALRDNRQIRLIGEKTYGKGSVQEVEQLKDGSSVKITVAEWLTPSGKNINKEGLQPDIEVKISTEDYDAGKDPQMEKAIQIISGN